MSILLLLLLLNIMMSSNQTVGPSIANNDLERKSSSDSSSTISSSDLSSSSSSSDSSSDFDGVGPSKLPITTNNNIIEDIELKSLEKLQNERVSFERRRNEEIERAKRNEKEQTERSLHKFKKEFSECASMKIKNIEKGKNLIVIKQSDINCRLKDKEYPLAMEMLKQKYGANVKCVLHKKLPFIGIRYKIELFVPEKE
jgi:hypothetical protein